MATGCIGAECGISSLDSATLPLWSNMPCEGKVVRGALNCCPLGDRVAQGRDETLQHPPAMLLISITLQAAEMKPL